MRGQILTVSFALAAAFAVFTGCEWTSSRGDLVWTGGFDEGGDLVNQMNFSGTYRNPDKGGCAIVTRSAGSAASSKPSEVVSEGYFDEFLGYSKDRTSYADQLKHPPKDGVAVVYTPDFTYSAEGGKLVCSAGDTGGSGTLNRNGGWTLFVPVPEKSGSIRIFYKPDIAGASEPVMTGSTSVEAITLSQSGSKLIFRTSNGVTMNGSITVVNVYSNNVSTAYNVQFEASGSNNSMVGTLDNRNGYNKLDATWTSDKTIYDVDGRTEMIQSFQQSDKEDSQQSGSRKSNR